MNQKAQKAAHLLKHYFKLLAEKSGVNLDSDCMIEIEEIVENILDAAGEYTDECIDDHNQAKISHMES